MQVVDIVKLERLERDVEDVISDYLLRLAITGVTTWI